MLLLLEGHLEKSTKVWEFLEGPRRSNLEDLFGSMLIEMSIFFTQVDKGHRKQL